MPNENYIKVEEIDKKKVLKRNHMHKSCWELLMDEKGTKRQALGMLKNIMSKVNDMGLVH